MKKFPEFRQELGAGFFRLDLPQKVNQVAVNEAMQQYRDLRTRILERPQDRSSSSTAIAVENDSE